MSELTNWIDEKYDEIKHTDLFINYFENLSLEQIDGDDTFYIENFECGIDVVFSHEFDLDAIHLFSVKILDLKAFKGDIPFAIEFLYDRILVRLKLGEPDVSGGGYEGQFGLVPYWDKYYYKTYSFHLQYSKDEKYIELITIGSLRFEKAINAE